MRIFALIIIASLLVFLYHTEKYRRQFDVDVLGVCGSSISQVFHAAQNINNEDYVVKWARAMDWKVCVPRNQYVLVEKLYRLNGLGAGFSLGIITSITTTNYRGSVFSREERIQRANDDVKEGYGVEIITGRGGGDPSREEELRTNTCAATVDDLPAIIRFREIDDPEAHSTFRLVVFDTTHQHAMTISLDVLRSQKIQVSDACDHVERILEIFNTVGQFE